MLEAGHDRGVGVGDLDRLRRAEQFVEKTHCGVGGTPRRQAVGEVATPCRATGDEGYAQRQKDKEGDREVDARHDHDGYDKGEQIAHHIGQPKREVRHFSHVVAVAVDSFARSNRRRQRAGSRQVGSQQVAPQQRADAIAEGAPRPGFAVARHGLRQPDGNVERDQRWHADECGRSAGDRVEDRLLEQTGDDPDAQVEDLQRSLQHEDPRRVADQPPDKPPGVQAAPVGREIEMERG